MRIEWQPFGGSPAVVDAVPFVKIPLSVDLPLNGRGVARLRLKDVLPQKRVDKFTIYDINDTDKLFEGIVVGRRVTSKAPHSVPFFCDVTLGDYSTYADWCYQTKDYPAGATLEEVLDDLVADKLSVYGTTVHPAQVTGPTLGPFSWVNKRVSDCLRELSDKTGYAFSFDPDNQLRMFVPGTDAAPFTVTDAVPNVQDIGWDDSTAVPANKIILLCGPDGVGDDIPMTWTADGVVFTFSLEGLNIPSSHEVMNITDVDGTEYPTWRAGEAPGGEGIEWDPETDDGTLSFLGAAAQALVPNGAVITIRYRPQFPFTVIATSGASPVIEKLFADTTVTNYDAGVELAEGLLAREDQEPRTLTMPSLLGGWRPGQAVAVVSPSRDINDSDATITNVSLEPLSDLTWRYLLTIQETTVPQPNYVDEWREFVGQGGASGGSSVNVISGGGGPTVLSSPFPLGGSRESSQEVGTASTPVIDWLPFVVTSASLSVRIRVTCRAREAGVEVTPVLTKYNSGTMVWDAFAPGTGVTSTTEVEQEIITVLTPGTYRLEYLTDDATGDAFTIGQAEGVAA